MHGSSRSAAEAVENTFQGVLDGEDEERDGINKTFGKVLKEWARLAGQHMRTTLVSQGSSLIAPVVPLLLCAPKFLDGSMTLGQVMQAASAFTIANVIKERDRAQHEGLHALHRYTSTRPPRCWRMSFVVEG